MRSISLLPALVITFSSLYSASAITTVTTDFGLLQVRGGAGWFGLFGNRVEDRYRQSLEEQILILERQTRAARDESMQLRKLAKLTGRGKQPGEATLVASIKEEIAVLEKQIEKLEKFTQELQVLLKEEKERSAELEEKLIAAGADALDLRNQHLLAMEELEKSMLIKANKQIEELNALMDARVKESAVRARKEALLFMDEKINEAVSKVEAKARADLEEERQKAADAVEKERAKMRKLVKVLAEREKKASAPAAGNGKASSNTVAAGSSSRKQQSVTPTSVRSPIKNT
ncbi:hypothetical protein MHU86_17987 [Fragilaria crotonensis]|nr:hypothetical protein MHU86_17987 [Fragilaria crotonensis]